MKIRPLALKDLYIFSCFLSQQWDLGKTLSRSKGNVCAWLYMFSVLSSYTKMFVLEDEKQVQGFSGYKLCGESDKMIHKLALWSFFACYHSPMIKNKKAIDDYYNIYSNITPPELNVKGSAELSILIVNKQARGKGYGKVLFDEVIKGCQLHQCDKLYIETDDSCSVDFYQRQGAKLIKRIPILENKGEPGSKNAFLYQYQIQREMK